MNAARFGLGSREYRQVETVDLARVATAICQLQDGLYRQLIVAASVEQACTVVEASELASARLMSQVRGMDPVLWVEALHAASDAISVEITPVLIAKIKAWRESSPAFVRLYTKLSTTLAIDTTQ
ncbi:MAG: hypothetical protein A2087_02490 [Spirochaetes bacterium GWD1_61_31]|nr:MAG: hypothetical protein A2Y37_13985 [Spirochaetes bacterium GWB1_60_80]OHD31082.1 MAG: hypothetical protein A2004_07795 [Spirochaetes bacterium GWC1_61_12]OHD38155.1 MAG: hypothetical protein A2087_02490 [Spirochaetes bacterium GWD1_61_31]OHD45299.1 MAG: hypothetical protein A2Y35_02565 [Spirochaetes bacterium GWE1_60_18]OHD59605.1 MAG: hypothetical protein A2Y32_12810 [Spirochaetes bacterium GWF1_60_12]HAP43983.1 hypothetical protein [Spirochaetaceae bacterium]